ncbi:MAG: hypothetical protein ABH836_02780, partial [Candidatus Omnitrophota bacterium]
MAKDNFSTDNSNRLLITRGQEQIVPDGSFKINKDNSLSYWLNEPQAWRLKYNLPKEIKFEGNWKLNDNYDLELCLSRGKVETSGEKIVLKGEIFSTGRDVFAFELRAQDKTGNKEFQILELSGSWSCGEQNEIIFLVDKKTGPDTLKLGAGWRINKNQQIIYSYEKTRLKTKIKDSHLLTFSGFWEISQKNTLTYKFSTGSKSRFDFRAAVQTPNLYPQKGAIKYRLGLGVKEGRVSRAKLVTLFGEWKFSKTLGLSFEMDYGKSNVRSLEFGADINLTSKNKITFNLVSRERKPLGINVTFSRKFLKKSDAEAFVKFKNLRADPAVEAGVYIP